jgi:hypothetical protein
MMAEGDAHSRAAWSSMGPAMMSVKVPHPLSERLQIARNFGNSRMYA